MTYSQAEKDQLVKYAKSAMFLVDLDSNLVGEAINNKESLEYGAVTKFCFDLAEAMVEEQRKRFGS